MKKLVLFLLLLLTIKSQSQNIVNAKITQITSSNISVTIYPSYYQNSILSNVVFSLKWRNNQNIALGNPQPVNSLAVIKSGPILTDGTWKYQIYNGLSFTATDIAQPIIINIPKSGTGKPVIANDNFINDTMINGSYYVSIGGQDVTGQILVTKSLEDEQDKQDETSQYKMYYNTVTNQFLFEVNGIFLTTVGQRVAVLDRTNLRLVKKID